eukprot:TRINITY_DN9132_c0_g1_i1.p1 TRINITY_DN9132_c0_g1~~TRINITY_DN9132_c0_g1_i1.p1  ORF type:complete len:732 (+),score=288.55 TRINITY_DN9132_c0_g1_i1:106-2196(+)
MRQASARSRHSRLTGTTERAQTVTQSEAILDADAFGEKTIGSRASFMLLVNNVTGPGLVTMCAINVSGGWFTTTLFLLLCWVISSLSTTMLLEAIKKVPGNSRFDQRIEFTTLAKYYFQGRRYWLYVVTLVVFMMSFITTLITSVIESAQTMDTALVAVFGKTCAIQLYDSQSAGIGGTAGLTCVTSSSSDSDSPFGSAYVVSIGYLIVMFISIPLGFWNLDDNIWVQNVAFVGLCFIVVAWVVQAAICGLEFRKGNGDEYSGTVPVFGGDQSSVFGTVLFNYAFVTAVPSWCNEREPGVSINRAVWSSAGLGTLMFFSVGLFGALAWNFATPEGKSDPPDLLAVLTSSDTRPHVGTMTQALAYLFPVVALVTSIPIFSIIVRYNLMENNICGRCWANFWGTIFPWIAAIALYSGSALNDVCNWSGLLTIAPLNFMLPAYFYLRSVEGMEEGDELQREKEGALPAAAAVLDTPPPEYEEGTKVDAWFPGYHWSRGVIVRRNPNGSYWVEWDEQDEKGVHCYTPEIPPRNVRPLGAGGKSEFLPNSAYRCPPSARELEAEKMNPVQRLAMERVAELQGQLDAKEQAIERLRAQLHQLIVENPGVKERRADKDAYLQRMLLAQREVEGVLDEMREARKRAIGEGGRWRLPPEQHDELFAAFPHSWSPRLRRRIALGLMLLSAAINAVALGYAIAGIGN